VKLCLVVQRYGIEVNGGSELAARLLAERLSASHSVEVLTTCAINYQTWADFYAPGEEIINGVKVRRFPVARQRDMATFCNLPAPLKSVKEGRQWIEDQGPYCPALVEYIRSHETHYDYFIFLTFRYYPSFAGVEAVAKRSILIPTAEDEAALDFLVYRQMFNMPRGIIYLTQEEKVLIERRIGHPEPPSCVIGLGIDHTNPTDEATFRKKHRLDGRYIIYLGRIDINKGCLELFDYFTKYKRQNTDDLQLCLVGQPFIEIPRHPDIVRLGFLSEEDKAAALNAALVKIMPSRYESFSFATLEAMRQRTPVLANEACAVVKGHCERSNGGLYYNGFYEFAAGLDVLLLQDELRKSMGLCGERYVLDHYDWPVVIKEYEEFLKELSSQTSSG
jgi:glycosyltransferase involved in cell wall biosynthesis